MGVCPGTLKKMGLSNGHNPSRCGGGGAATRKQGGVGGGGVAELILKKK